MLSAFLIALREGVEASLVVGIILVYLSRTGRGHLARFVWYGVAVAAALSLGVAVALERFHISEDGFEGLMLLIAAVFVITMIVWMNRVARHLKKEIEQKVESYAGRAGAAAGWGIFLLLWGALAVGSADNIIKPYFISRGTDLPFILVFLGALGGVISFGFLGIFLGPTLLAVGYNIIRDWTRVESASSV